MLKLPLHDGEVQYLLGKNHNAKILTKFSDGFQNIQTCFLYSLLIMRTNFNEN